MITINLKCLNNDQFEIQNIPSRKQIKNAKIIINNIVVGLFPLFPEIIASDGSDK
jgi:hypothetical protein